MILVNRGRPARVPAASAPTRFFAGSLVCPVITWPLESVLTGVENRRRSSGASGPTGARTCIVKLADDVAAGVPDQPHDQRSGGQRTERGGKPCTSYLHDGSPCRLQTMSAMPLRRRGQTTGRPPRIDVDQRGRWRAKRYSGTSSALSISGAHGLRPIAV
jgi:hypothetical protein